MSAIYSNYDDDEMIQPPRPEGRGLLRRLFRMTLWLGFASLAVLTLAGIGLYFHINETLPKINSLADYHPPVVSRVFSDDGRLVAEFYTEKRIVIPLSEMPEMLKAAFIAAEDSRFFQHKGIDLIGIARAFFKNLEAGTIVQGGSTITQQVTKSFFLTPERSYDRKIKEAILAYRIDNTFTKEEILFLYLNQIYLGHGAYGVEAAAENYFGKSALDLSLAECAMLAGLPQAPSRFSPYRAPDRARARQLYVLNRMVADGVITPKDAEAAAAEKLNIHSRRNLHLEVAPYYTEYIRRYLQDTYGTETLYRGGLTIHTALNIEMQQIAQEEIMTGLRDLDKRQGYRGPLAHIEPHDMSAYEEQLKLANGAALDAGTILKALVTSLDSAKNQAVVSLGHATGYLPHSDLRWARRPNSKIGYFEARAPVLKEVLKPGAVILVRLKEPLNDAGAWLVSLEQDPLAQAALLTMEAATGHVKAMVGGRSYQESQFNRATQSRRQPGSAFKPIVYAAALDKGYTPASVMIDAPLVFQGADASSTWKPQNYSREFQGQTLFRRALETSLNVVTVKLLQDIGIDYTIEYARKLGITSEMEPYLSLALGSFGVSLLELVNAYATFCNLGYRSEPIFITRIEDRHGNVLEDNQTRREKVIDAETAYLMTSLLEGAVQNGTGRRVRALNRPVAGKTGTTNNLFDAWFAGYTPEYITGTWVGFDDVASLGKGETGARAASPIWLGYMQRVMANKPIRPFTIPPGIVFTKIDATTGLLPIAESQKTIFESFREGSAPTAYTRHPGAYQDAEEFYRSFM